MVSRIHLLAAALLVVLLGACTTTDPRTSAEFTAAQTAPARLAGRTILLLPADIECGQVTAGGLVQPNAAWTATAEANVMAALERSFAGRGATLVTYDPAGVAADRAVLHDRVLKLNEAVGGSIFFLQDVLPTKRAVFEWSVGEGARHLGDDFDADYALFVFLRDTHASAGLVGMNVLKSSVGWLPLSILGLLTGDVDHHTGAGDDQRRSGRLRPTGRPRDRQCDLVQQAQRHVGGRRSADRAQGRRGGRCAAPRLPDLRPAMAVVAALALAACAASEPLPDLRPGERPALHTDEAGLWMATDRVEERLRSSGARLRDPALEGYLHGIACKLSPDHCHSVRIYVIEQPHFNASIMPNGAMQVWTGMLLRVDSEDQLALVIGHELAHFERRHTLQQWRAVRSRAALAEVAGTLGGTPGSLLASSALLMSTMAYSREQEREADALGIARLPEAGYDAKEAAASGSSSSTSSRCPSSRRGSSFSPPIRPRPTGCRRCRHWQRSSRRRPDRAGRRVGPRRAHRTAPPDLAPRRAAPAAAAGDRVALRTAALAHATRSGTALQPRRASPPAWRPG
jgi:hypothetical protein